MRQKKWLDEKTKIPTKKLTDTRKIMYLKLNNQRLKSINNRNKVMVF